MKLLFTALLFVIAPFANAADLSFEVRPSSPLVIYSDLTLEDGKQIHGPWFEMKYKINNLSPEQLSIAGIRFTVTSIEGAQTKEALTFDQIEEIDFENYFASTWHIGSLPASASAVYNVEVRVIGWKNSIEGPGQVFSEVFHFTTQ